MRYRILQHALILALALASTGCPDSSAPVPETVVRPDVLVLQTGGNAPPPTIEPDRLIFDTIPEGLRAGTVLVSELGGGILRRVVSVGQENGRTVARTESASLTDVFERARIRVQIPVGPDDIQDIEPLPPGVELVPEGRNQGKWTVRLNNLALAAGAGVGEQGGAVVGTLNGTLSVILNIDLQIDIDGSDLKFFRLVPTVGAGVNLQVNVTGLRGSQMIRRFKTRPFTVTVGGIPVVIDAVFLLEAKLAAEATGLEFRKAFEASVGAGVEYRNGSLTGVGESRVENTTFSAQLPPQQQFQLGFTPLSAELQIRLYQALGAYTVIDSPFLPLKYQRVTTPSDGARVQLEAVVQGTGGVRASVWDGDLVLGDISLDPWRFYEVTVFDRFIPDTGAVEVTIR
ncbi:MAG: hypothetical protein RMJ43_13680 [Chloroherpetonaceae bacterium]|nr:hypothetical protein [Chthonomonadaceae bacterium]MDW8208879.1 hypothetical protein [Chloroherpetonaceae bacterium]